MKYSVNLECYRHGFMVPRQLVENHLKLAGALQLKVLLWICGHDGYCESVEAVAEDLGATPTDVQDALQYWLCNDILYPCDGSAGSDTVAKTVTCECKITPIKPSQKAQKPNRSEVAKRGSESPEISWLFCEAQNKFGRSLSFAESSTLLWIVDTYGMSPAIVLMLIEYASSINQCNIKFIEKSAAQWFKNEIDSVEKAEEYLTKLEQNKNDWGKITHIFGIDKRKPTKSEEIYIDRWLHEWKFTSKMLQCAYDQCVNHTGKINFSYINKVLEQWFANGYKKPEDIDTTPASKTTRSKLQSVSSMKETSYSMDDIENLI